MGWIKAGLDSFVDPDIPTVPRCDRHKREEMRQFGYLERQDRRVESLIPKVEGKIPVTVWAYA
jgi:hypothetical protein